MISKSKKKIAQNQMQESAVSANQIPTKKLPGQVINRKRSEFCSHQRKVKPKNSFTTKVKNKASLGSRVKKIDKRGLYSLSKESSKHTGATLELDGWKWDKIPSLQDTTEECGKIVFAIKVDENGEIISIRTIEKTVSPLVEKIYSDALRELTFSKISENQSYVKISTGKVSFILVPK